MRGFDELRSCYDVIMKQLKGDTRRYWLQTDNNTTLGNILRQAYKVRCIVGNSVTVLVAG